MTYTIVHGTGSRKVWLNHAMLATKSFGSEDMAFTTENSTLAHSMLRLTKRANPGKRNIRLETAE